MRRRLRRHRRHRYGMPEPGHGEPLPDDPALPPPEVDDGSDLEEWMVGVGSDS